MDYSKVPLHKRTRLQFVQFYKKYHEEKMKVKNGGGESAGSVNREGGERKLGGHGVRVEGLRSGGGFESESAAVGGGCVVVGGGVIGGENEIVSDQEGVDSVNFERGESLGMGKNSKSKKGFKRTKPGDQIDVDSKNIGKKGSKRTKFGDQIDVDSKKIQENSKRGLRKKVSGGVELKAKGELTKSSKENKIGVDDDDGNDGSDSEVEFLIEVIHSNGSSLNEVVSSSLGESSAIKIDEKKSGLLGQAQSLIGASTESQDVGEDDSIDSEDSETSSEEDNDDSNDDDYRGNVSSSSDCSDDSSSYSEDENEDNEDKEEAVEKDDDDDEGSIVKTKSTDGKGKEKEVEVVLNRKHKPCRVLYSEQLSFYTVDNEREDGNGSSIMKEGSVDGKEKERSFEGGLKRRKFCGLDILVDCNEEKVEELKSATKRLRPRSVSKSRKQKLNLGTVSHPLPVEEEELDSSSAHDDDNDGNDGIHGKGKGELGKPIEREHIHSGKDFDALKIIADSIWEKGDGLLEKIVSPGEKSPAEEKLLYKFTLGEKLNLGTVSHPHPVKEKKLDSSSGHDDDNDGKDGNCVRKFRGEGKGELGRPIEREHIHARTDFDALKILADSIWEKGDGLLQKIVSPRQKSPTEEKLLYKFSLADNDPKRPEKPQWMKEIDALFAEMDMALRSCEMGSFSSAVDDNDKTISTGTEDPATLCHQGKHQLILDEQIGIRCKFCSFVGLEIKHILPSFSKHPWGRWDKSDFDNVDHSGFFELQFQDPGCGYQYGSKGYVHDKGTVWDMIPGIRESLYPHQREGFEFIWKNLAGGIRIELLERPLSDGGSGCIISHAPGTGKTRLTIVFLQTFMKLYPESRPVIIAPRSMLFTWEEEFRKWNVDIPFHNLNLPELSRQENKVAANFLKKVGSPGRSTYSIRMLKLYSWTKERSILGISYRLFEKLAGGGERKRKVKRHPQDDQIRKILLELPSVLVLDEGHTPRNDQSFIWKALSKVGTQRRIILSGTPFQNNFNELYNTLCLMDPNFADRISSKNCGDFGKKRGRSDAARGRWASLTSSIAKNANDKLRELRAMIDPFVHVHKGTILQEKLPGLRDALVVLQPSDLQKILLKSIEGRKNPLELARLVSLISIHPSLSPEYFLSEKEEFSAHRVKLEKLKLDPRAGVKIKFLIELIRLSGALSEKVLVFSQFINPLTFIMTQLKTHFNWVEGREVLYMDGQVEEKQRQMSISSLNDPASEVRVLLASTRACSEGINLVGASRVVLLDVVWNPSVERQAISRAYRLGQKKIVYIYHLITSGTIEGEKYVRQGEKDRLSELVFSSIDKGSCKPEISSPVSDDKILEEMVQHAKLRDIFEKILYQPKESDLIETFGLVDL